MADVETAEEARSASDIQEQLEELEELVETLEEEEKEREEKGRAISDEIESFRKKLRQKPNIPPYKSEITSCGVWEERGGDRGGGGDAGGGSGGYSGGEGDGGNVGKYSTGDRLSVNTITKLDLIKSQIPFPKGSVPPLSLPSWHALPLEKKIPLVQSPKGLMYYSRGKLGESLLRRTVEYGTRDPLNFERNFGPYCALHDPHTQEYLNRPIYKALLIHQGLINKEGEVICSLQEFNRFRDYLRSLYSDEIDRWLSAGESFAASQQEQFRALMKSEAKAIGMAKQSKRNQRIADAKKFQADNLEFKRKMAKQRQRLDDQRLKEWQNEKERRVLEHMLKGMEEQRKNHERLQALRAVRVQYRKDILIKSTRKFLETEARTKTDKGMMDEAYNKFLLEWLEAKYEYSQEKMMEQRQLRQELTYSMKYKAQKRQKRLEQYRKQMPGIQEKRKNEHERLWAIVRKFAMRWLEKVRAKMNKPNDLKHESCWTSGSKNVLDETVKYLYRESGYEKLDDFILNIMKLKKQIQAQIELEEAEEVALLAGQETEDGSTTGSAAGGTVNRSEAEANDNDDY